MYTITDIYNYYHIMPTLRQHQLRVAAVGVYIARHSTHDVSETDIATALLLHDMGNIIKFDFRIFPDFCNPEGAPYWERIQRAFRLRYGHNEHHAHLEIARELGMPEHIIHYIDAVGFSMMNDTHTSDSFEQKICAYADQRVGPFGVISLKERLHEGRIRYNITEEEARYDLVESVLAIEHDIFSAMDVSPDAISDEAIADIMRELEDFVIEDVSVADIHTIKFDISD